MAATFFFLMLCFNDKLLICQMNIINSVIYFIADLFVRFDYLKTFHHILCAFGCALALITSSQDTIYVSKLIGLIETSNPFWTFLRLRVEKSEEIYLPSWYTRNIAGIVYILAFFFIRIIWFSYVLYYELPDNISLVIYYLTFFPFQILNIYFFYVLISKSIKAIRK
jgi:hypothetical protein